MFLLARHTPVTRVNPLWIARALKCEIGGLYRAIPKRACKGRKRKKPPCGGFILCNVAETVEAILTEVAYGRMQFSDMPILLLPLLIPQKFCHLSRISC